MTSSNLSPTAAEIVAIEVDAPPRMRANELLRAVAPYLFAPLATGILFVSAVGATAHPIPAIVSCMVLAALIGPTIDIWRRRCQRAQRNEVNARSNIAT